MIPVERAIEVTLAEIDERSHVDQVSAEILPLDSALGRVLREDILADSDYPRFDKAIRDGFAVRYEDLKSLPAVLKVIGESRAGQGSETTVVSGTCCEIMTGAPLPPGANAVVMVEHTEAVSSGEVRILRPVREGEGLLRQAAELKRGEPVLKSGRRIELADIGTLASFGKSQVSVARKPSVAILATGDELVEVSQIPSAGQIRNSNSYTLQAQVHAAGAEPVLLGIGRDNLEDLRLQIGRGLEHDVLLVSGGVSMGKYDFVEPVFAEFGVRVLFDSVAMKPGKPTVFGIRGKTFVFGLPGNPVSTIVAFRMFVAPVIRGLLQVEGTTGQKLYARLESATKRDAARTAIVPAHVHFNGTSYGIRIASWKGSSDLAGVSRSNALVVIPAGDGDAPAGEWLEFFSLESW